MAKKYPKTKYFKSDSWTASLESHSKGYSITYFLFGRVHSTKTFYLSDGYNRSVARIAALRELKSGHFEEIK